MHDTGTQPAQPPDDTTPAIRLDEEWVDRLRHFDDRAWETLLRSYAKDLRGDIVNSLRKRGLPIDYVDDVEQETWRTAVKTIEAFQWQGESEFYHWLRKISYHHVQTLRGKTRDDQVSFEDIDDVGNELSLDLFLYSHGVIEDSPENEIDLRDSLKALETAMQYLKPRDREILLRRLLWQETPQQMAADYGVEAATISVILVRAKEAIRAQLTALDFLRRDKRHD